MGRTRYSCPSTGWWCWEWSLTITLTTKDKLEGEALSHTNLLSHLFTGDSGLQSPNTSNVWQLGWMTAGTSCCQTCFHTSRQGRLSGLDFLSVKPVEGEKVVSTDLSNMIDLQKQLDSLSHSKLSQPELIPAALTSHFPVRVVSKLGAEQHGRVHEASHQLWGGGQWQWLNLLQGCSHQGQSCPDCIGIHCSNLSRDKPSLLPVLAAGQQHRDLRDQRDAEEPGERGQPGVGGPARWDGRWLVDGYVTQPANISTASLDISELLLFIIFTVQILVLKKTNSIYNPQHMQCGQQLYIYNFGPYRDQGQYKIGT